MLFYLKIKSRWYLSPWCKKLGQLRFATAQELSGFKDSEPTNNMSFFKNRLKWGYLISYYPFKWQLNKNVVVVGLPGDGKTFTYVKPNLMQMNSSFIVTDPKRTLSS